MTVRIIRSCGTETEVSFPSSVSMSALTDLLYREGIVAIEIVKVTR